MEPTTHTDQLLSSLQKALKTIHKLKADLATRKEPIAIIGMGCRFPEANNPTAFWQLLQEGRDAVVEIPPERWNLDAYYDPQPNQPGKMYARRMALLEMVDQFNPRFFGISPREAVSLDPQQRLLLEVSWEALEFAGIAPDQLVGSQTGLFVGIGQNDYAQWRLKAGFPEHVDAYDASGNLFCFAAGRLSYFLGLQGPSMALDTACSSSLVAIHQAVMSLRARECDMALGGGVHLILSPEMTISLSRMQALSPDGRCKTFDAAADGYGRGEGCGMLVLKRFSDAVSAGDNILALIRGSAINHDGPSSGLTVPNGPAQEALIRQALANAKVEPHQVSYIEAHGTGTSLGDPIEVRALGRLFANRSQPLMIGSVKTNIGHLEAAAGVAGLIKVILAFQHKEIPPHLHFQTPNPHIEWGKWPLVVPTERTSWPHRNRVAGVSSFGMSGTNAHVVLEEAPRKEPVPTKIKRPLHLLTLSGKAEEALKELVARYQKQLAAYHALWVHPDMELADICFTANTGRSHFTHRLSVVAADLGEMSEKLAAFTAGQEVMGVFSGQLKLKSATEPKVAFLFTGQGSQYVGMGRQLYETQPTFRQTLSRCDEFLTKGGYLEQSLLEVLYPVTRTSPLNETAYTQVALFAIEYALAKLWQSWGIEPDVVMGHSVGEYVAACVAGVFSLEDGLRLIAERGRLMQALPQNGEMVSLLASEQKVVQAIVPYRNDISIAAVNGPESVVITGKRDAVMAIAQQLADEGVKTRKLIVSHAFHSPLMVPMLTDFRQVAESITYHEPNLPLVTNLTGQLAGDEVMTPDYWVRHVREPVRFADGVATLHEQGISIFLEVGPKPTLLGLAGQVADDKRQVTLLPSLRAERDWQQMLTSLGELYVRGVEIDWAGFDRDYQRRKVILPTYPFQRERYWVKSAHDHESLSRLRTLLDKIVHASLNDPEEMSNEIVTEILGFEVRVTPKKTPAWQDWLYTVAWQSYDSPTVLPEQKTESYQDTSTLIFATQEGFGSALANQLHAQGNHCTLVIAGEEYGSPQLVGELQTATINLNEPQHSQWLLNDLQRGNGALVTSVIYFSPENRNLEVPQRVVELNGGLLHLVQALIETNLTPRLWVVTEKAQAVSETDTINSTQASLWGLARTIAAEHPELNCTRIDLAQETELSSLLAELHAPDEENQVALRSGRRYVARLMRPNEVEIERQGLNIHKEGSYLITGGLGGLGLQVAQQLALEGAGQLVLASRRAIRSERTQKLILELEEADVQVHLVQADVSVESDVARLLSACPEPLRGIIHAAGVLDDGVLSQQNVERFEKVMAPKVSGAWHLHRLTMAQEMPLDFFVCFSSVASLLGEGGQGNYAAANAFLDGLMQQRRAMGLPGLSINWGAWAEVGMAANLQDRMRSKALKMIPPKKGRELLIKLINRNINQVIVLPIDWSSAAAQSNTFELVMPYHALRVQQTKLPTAQASWRQQLTNTPPENRLAFLSQHVHQQVAHVLGCSEEQGLDARQVFSDLGMDSLMAIELRNRLQDSLETQLPASLIYDYPTPEELCTYLAQQLILSTKADELSATEHPDDPSRFEQVSEDQLGDLLDHELQLLATYLEENHEDTTYSYNWRKS